MLWKPDELFAADNPAPKSTETAATDKKLKMASLRLFLLNFYDFG